MKLTLIGNDLAFIALQRSYNKTVEYFLRILSDNHFTLVWQLSVYLVTRYISLLAKNVMSLQTFIQSTY